jgi:sugar/nucleoside kinase (ribokinase family)
VDAARRLTGSEAEPAASALGKRYRLVCVTRGARGAIGVLDGRSALASTEPVEGDVPGAGDAFAAAVLVALASGRPLDEALVAGCRAGRVAAGGR